MREEHAGRSQECERRRSGPSGARVWLLAGVCLLLLPGGASQSPELTAAGAPAGPELDAPAIAQIMASVNPTLSAREIERISSAVMRYSAKYQLDPEIVTAVMLVESSARPWARSPKGARGLMQVMPYMMRPLGIAGNASTIETNVEAGCIILAENIRRLGEEDGISAYFWGSDIRGVGYLERVQSARARVREHTRS